MFSCSRIQFDAGVGLSGTPVRPSWRKVRPARALTDLHPVREKKFAESMLSFAIGMSVLRGTPEAFCCGKTDAFDPDILRLSLIRPFLKDGLAR